MRSPLTSEQLRQAAALRERQPATWTGLAWGAAIATLAGALFLSSDNLLTTTSYDLAYVDRKGPPVPEPDDVALILVDERSFDVEGLPRGVKWNRRLHAEMLDLLTQSEARAVVLDFFFPRVGSTLEEIEADRLLVEAVRRNGRVFAVTQVRQVASPDPALPLRGIELVVPFQALRDALRGYGPVVPDPSGRREARRQFLAFDPPNSPLPEQICRYVNQIKGSPDGDFWMLHYGPPGTTFPHYSYSEVLRETTPAERERRFRDRVVFIGVDHRMASAIAESDLWYTPYTRLGYPRSPGVEIVATGYLNLRHGHELRRLPRWQEVLLLAGLGGLGVLIGGCFRPLVGAGLVLGAAILVGWICSTAVWSTYVWFPWLIAVAIQFPFGLAWGCMVRRRAAIPRPEPSKMPPLPVIPDYDVLKLIGRGAFGEVWLCRSAIGQFRAAKIIRRMTFRSDRPYQRAFDGIQRYAPVSLAHAHLVPILHVGQRDAEGYFFYIMELADDAGSGTLIDPDRYTPRNLAAELDNLGHLPLEEAVHLAERLSDGLAALHDRQLVHRDIKPANIVFIGGSPKLADVDTVAATDPNRIALTMVGTPGYFAPEGPGRNGADIFSLGKVIYASVMGMDPGAFPELPEWLPEHPDCRSYFKLNDIILRACEMDARHRYSSAAELREDLRQFRLDLMRRQEPDRPAKSAAAILTADEASAPVIPDYEVIKPLGRGAFGEVWLCRSAIGIFRAVKVIRRANFRSERPYQRAFEGIQRYAPVSLSHPHLVPILHVGRRDDEGYLFYVMELADDIESGTAIDSARYTPKSLALELSNRGRLPLMEAVLLTERLADGLAVLHDCQLVHRDIKPANIVFVGGSPKLADVDTVAVADPEIGPATFVGTPGYFAPEGPGRTSADIFSLGKVIYAVVMGMDPGAFPELPDWLPEHDERHAYLQLNNLILRACEMDARQRCPSAAELRDDLRRFRLDLTGRLPPGCSPP